MNILTIAGSDPSSGAGIQSDIKTFSSFDCHGLTAITAITSQNSSKFSNVEAVSPKMLEDQMESIFSDFKVNSIKIGMVFNSAIIKTIHKKIKNLNIPIVVDPVLKSTTGGLLLETKAIPDFKKYIISISTVITPNKYELEMLSGKKIRTRKDISDSVKILKKIGAKNVILTGVEDRKKVLDYIFLENNEYVMSNNKISKKNHGSGCNYSAALTAALTKGNNLSESIKIAKEFSYNSIKNSKKLGKGLYITEQKKQTKNELKLKKSIDDFTMQKGIWNYIPECQTNFVFSKSKPKTTKDILGLEGRIVKSGKKVIVVGDIIPGGSKHVASAVLEMNKKFPQICSGVNIKYDKKIIEKAKKAGLKVTCYDRSAEPKSIKNKENSSISWGVKNALKNAKFPYDIIFHKGDFGKESMIIVFGKEPNDVIKKISRIV